MNSRNTRNLIALRWIELVVLVVVALVYGWSTYQRNLVWKDEFTFWSDVVTKSPDKARPYRCLGTFFYKQKGLTDMAITYIKISLRLDPYNADAHNNLGICYFSKEWIDEAITEFEYAIRINPDHLNAHYNLAVAYKQKNLLELAIKHYKEVTRINPDDIQARERMKRLMSH